jgi:hypothetical protein
VTKLEYKSPKWFNLTTAKLLNTNNQYNKINFPKSDSNINVNIFKTNSEPNFIITSEKEKMIEDHIEILYKYLQTNLKKCKNPIDEKTLLKKVTKKSNEIDTVIRSKKIFLNLNNDQKSIIKNWIHHCKELYNICINKHLIDNKFFNKGYKAIKKKLFDSIYKKSKKPVPYDILTDEVKVFCSAKNKKNKFFLFFA